MEEAHFEAPILKIPKRERNKEIFRKTLSMGDERIHDQNARKQKIINFEDSAEPLLPCKPHSSFKRPTDRGTEGKTKAEEMAHKS